MRFEQYLQFFQLSWQSNISKSSLNQIIEMHGFRKLHQECKALVQECVESIELLEPTRSSLEESISSCAFVAADEIGADLEDLGWQECLLVRSVRTLKSEAEQEYVIANEDLPFVPCGSTSADEAAPRRRRGRRVPPEEFVIVGKRPRSKRKRVSVNALIAGGGGCCGGRRSSASSSSVVIDGDFVPPPPSYPRPATPPPPSSPPPPFSPTPMVPPPTRVPFCFASILTI